jgi:hypothetical protein
MKETRLQTIKKLSKDLEIEKGISANLTQQLSFSKHREDELQLRIKLLQIELKRKHQWWKFWR